MYATVSSFLMLVERREEWKIGGAREAGREGNRGQVFIWGRGLWDLPPRISCHN